jgi:uncharacterized repeat protein (TIGR01451 family)
MKNIDRQNNIIYLLSKIFQTYLLILVCSLPFNHLFNQTINMTPINCTTDCNNFNFTVSNWQDAFSSSISGVSYFWYFGNGEISYSANPLNIKYFNNIPATALPAYVELTPTAASAAYRDGDDPSSRNVNTLHPDLCTNCPDYFAPSVSPPYMLMLSPNRSFVKGNIVSFVITYSRNNSCTTPSIIDSVSGKLTFWFDPSTLELESGRAPIIHNTFGSDQYVTEMSLNKMEWPIPPLLQNQTNHAIIRMIVKDDLPIGTMVEAKAKIELYRGLSSTEKLCDSLVFFSEASIESHDPNGKLSIPEYFNSPSVNDIITYTIRYQNDAAGPATQIIIKDFIHDKLSLENIEILYPKNIAGDVPLHYVDTSKRELSCTLSGDFIEGNLNKLIGLEDPDLGTLYSYEDTYDYFIFSTTLDRQMHPCDALVNRTEIIFDKNDPIYTEPAVTPTTCYLNSFISTDTSNQRAVSPFDLKNKKEDKIDTIKDKTFLTSIDTCLFDSIIPYNGIQMVNNGSGVTLNYDVASLPHPGTANDIANNHFLQWYPSYGLDDPTIPFPVASPCQDMIYYLVAVSKTDCKRTIFECPVKAGLTACKKPSPKWWPWVLGIAIIGIIVFLIIKLQKP